MLRLKDPVAGGRQAMTAQGWGKTGVTRTGGNSSVWTQVANRLAATRASFAHPAKGFVSQPEPRIIGFYGRGKQLLAGNYLFAGHLVEAPGQSIWRIAAPDAAFTAALHGFGWLDDLAAVGDAEARVRAQAWTWEWISQSRRGWGPGWTPDLTGRRLIRLINNALMLLSGRSRAESDAFYALMSAQTIFLSRRWQATSPGLPRFEALTGLIYAGLALTGMERRVGPATQALARECRSVIDAKGGIATRNPEELLEVFSLLTWAAQALGETGNPVPPNHLDALERIAPTLRALRHADGGLARFHGGDRGLEGRLDAALVASGVKPLKPGVFSMGFGRLSGGRTTLIVDAASPPSGAAGALAHASTLAFELTSGRRPLIVSCGPGASFGADWQRMSRATASHSALSILGMSSTRFGTGSGPADTPDEPADIRLCRTETYTKSQGLHLAHGGWVRSHGLIHGRELVLSQDGRNLVGYDELIVTSPADQARLAEVLTRYASDGLRYAVHFHLHPDVEPEIDMGGAAVSLALKSGEIWIFRPDAGPVMTLEPSVYLEQGRLKPRMSQQIVLNGRILSAETQIGWTLAKAQDTPLAIRDTEGI
jgi:uncharacterized heparinase superfamily protein